MTPSLAAAPILGLLASATSPPTAAASEPLAQWNVIAVDAARSQPPVVQTRTLALVHAAMFDAANGVDRRFTPHLVDRRPPGPASGPAAAAAAACAVLEGLFPERRAALTEALAASTAPLPAGAEREGGVAFGRLVGAAVLARRAADGASATRSYQPGSGIGTWRPTPPGNLSAFAPHWGDVRPFLIDDPARFAPPAPPAIGSARYARDLDEVAQVGGARSARRTPDQTEAAVFWTGFASPIWSSAARQAIAHRQDLSLVERARVFALLSGAMADAAVVGWAAKYRYGLWRPVTAIRLAASDGNDATAADPGWEPLVVTPPFPCYVSGHAIAAGAAERALALALGQDRFDLRITNDAVGLTRRYGSFSQLAQEAHEARIWGGVHFRVSQEEGLRAGRRIGEASVASRLQPLLARRERPPAGGTAP
jgi:hypothetical protein